MQDILVERSMAICCKTIIGLGERLGMSTPTVTYIAGYLPFYYLIHSSPGYVDSLQFLGLENLDGLAEMLL